MTRPDPEKNLPAFREKISREGLPEYVAETFSHYYRQVVSGETGMLYDRDISPVGPEEVTDTASLEGLAETGKHTLDQAVHVVLNGGLGTSMGLTRAKSLLEVKHGKTFLEIIVRRADHKGVSLALMDSFNTHADTVAALELFESVREPHLFMQHKFPKILQADFSPAQWPQNPDLEWNPPGHGDVYAALHASGMLQTLLDQNIFYALISNSDNLGGVMDESLLGFFKQQKLSFMMEVAQKTPSDIKGGHLAKTPNGRFLLREAAQCPPEEIDSFQNIERYRYFNTNNIWVDLRRLQTAIETHGVLPLPIIVNPKTLDPRDETSPPVYQVETAMGAAISLFDQSAAACVPRNRFLPVKKCNDLLVIRSDRFVLSEDAHTLVPNPRNRSESVEVDLDAAYYKKIDDFDQRFPEGAPSLVECEALRIRGDVRFESDVVLSGEVTIENSGRSQVVVKAGSELEGRVRL